MFTGIIKGKAKINIVLKNETDMRIKVELGNLKTKIGIGDSIALDGVCLTITNFEDGFSFFDLMNETLEKTNFRNLIDGYEMNVEPSIRFDSKLDGHIVYGDVDSVGEIIDIKNVGDSSIYKIKYPKEYAKYLINKGRITLDGASLTVIDSEEDGMFSVSLIPHSLKELNIKNKNSGDVVNLEYDVYAKIIYKQRRFND